MKKNELRGISVRTRQYRGDVHNVSLSVSSHGTVYLGRYDDLEQAKRIYDAAKVLFFHATGQADKLSVGHWFNTPETALRTTKQAARDILGTELAAAVEAKAALWLAAKTGTTPKKQVLTLAELTDKVLRLESQLAALSAAPQTAAPDQSSL